MPSWIPGIYDDADYDDVVMMLTDMSKGGTDPPARLVQVKPCPIVVGLVRPVVTWPSALTGSLALHFRSPPLP
jgi:hypothetical protein